MLNVHNQWTVQRYLLKSISDHFVIGKYTLKKYHDQLDAVDARCTLLWCLVN